ncbi:glycosyltransferase family 4 protein [Paludisphaera mucosa]|uniref:Glycosyltransferase family 1 protein n=1 Tax=Paludisphaera mucosa TaxID=3030827 RepID=A0ABT6FHK0_9BACT|nr:glycosyltransferase family 1 protein [Paludisphaera mucosa]MDG3006989.1 glycosyltransferase family 1 protein [Paludisphaera mucosa]
MIRVAWLYDMNACYAPTGVTRHALAQLERLAARPDVALKVVSGKIAAPEGRAYWQGLGTTPRRELPVRTRDLLRWWRVAPLPPMEWLSGPTDWVYCPAEFRVRTLKARVAVTSHDVLQGFQFGSERLRKNTTTAFKKADLVLSVSEFNTARLLEAVPDCTGKVAYVPNAADDLFFEPCPAADRERIREDLGLPAGLPYLLSVANFQPRKNLIRLIRAAAHLKEVAAGELALVLLGSGIPDEERTLREAIAGLGPKAAVRLPGYRQGETLRAAYAEAAALVFPSLCESFGIPAVEAMAQGTPVALADSTALPEIGGEAGWYFDPEDETAIAGAIRDLLDRADERARRVEAGRSIAAGYRWDAANDRLVAAMTAQG